MSAGVSFPACFESREQYADWRKSALAAGEAVSPCADCTPDYCHRMTLAGRCDPEFVRALFLVRSRGYRCRHAKEGKA